MKFSIVQHLDEMPPEMYQWALASAAGGLFADSAMNVAIVVGTMHGTDGSIGLSVLAHEDLIECMADVIDYHGERALRKSVTYLSDLYVTEVHANNPELETFKTHQIEQKSTGRRLHLFKTPGILINEARRVLRAR